MFKYNWFHGLITMENVDFVRYKHTKHCHYCIEKNLKNSSAIWRNVDEQSTSSKDLQNINSLTCTIYNTSITSECNVINLLWTN